MRLEFLDKLGTGAFGEVWKARDELNRICAVKILFGDQDETLRILDQARALARVSHPNIVAIYTVEKVRHPETDERSDAIIMAYNPGKTLSDCLRGPRFGSPDTETIGCGIIDGLKHLHENGVVHADLHDENILIHEGNPTIIDVLYKYSLADLTEKKRERKRASDVRSLRMILEDVLSHSGVSQEAIESFVEEFPSDGDFAAIKSAFSRAASRQATQDRGVDRVYKELMDPHFVDSEAYAQALAAETPEAITGEVLSKMIAARGYSGKHRKYVDILQGRLGEDDFHRIMVELNAALEADVPDGAFGASMSLLVRMGRRGWKGLRVAFRIKLESMIVKGVLAGRHDVHSANLFMSNMAQLGTYAGTLWRYFDNRDELIDSIESMLRRDWYTQNYIARYLITTLPRLVRNDDERERMVGALAVAVRNDATLIKARLEKLPSDWERDIRRRALRDEV